MAWTDDPDQLVKQKYGPPWATGSLRSLDLFPPHIGPSLDERLQAIETKLDQLLRRETGGLPSPEES